MIKHLTKRLLERSGVYIKFYENLPAGVDWLLDTRRNVPLPEHPVVFDVGANVGQTVMEVKRCLPNARIYAFEPVSSTFGRLVDATERVPGVSCHRMALGAEPCSREVRVAPLSKCNSLVNDVVAREPDAHEETIEVTTAGAFCEAHAIDRIDILKTDTEGFDCEVFRGAEPLFEAEAINAVYVEVAFADENPKNTPFRLIFEFLIERGFRLAGLYELGWFQRKPWRDAWCNALFLRKAVAGPNRDEHSASRTSVGLTQRSGA